ncbi:hypothetical protein CPB86DRAFT_185536 [Serendipita vermifera]|nr:hypothetical protein CPB86DRAFT_185536 [Serendipita vermifera]
MRFGPIHLYSPPTSISNTDGRPIDSIDAHFTRLVEEYHHAVRLQNTLRSRMERFLEEREAEFNRKEEEAKERLRRIQEETELKLRKIQEEKENTRKSNAFMREMIIQAELMGNNEKEEAGVAGNQGTSSVLIELQNRINSQAKRDAEMRAAEMRDAAKTRIKKEEAILLENWGQEKKFLAEETDGVRCAEERRAECYQMVEEEAKNLTEMRSYDKNMSRFSAEQALLASLAQPELTEAEQEELTPTRSHPGKGKSKKK